jgi:hypothetical protein
MTYIGRWKGGVNRSWSYRIHPPAPRPRSTEQTAIIQPSERGGIFPSAGNMHSNLMIQKWLWQNNPIPALQLLVRKRMQAQKGECISIATCRTMPRQKLPPLNLRPGHLNRRRSNTSFFTSSPFLRSSLSFFMFFLSCFLSLFIYLIIY